MKAKPITSLRNPASLMEEVKDKEPILITKNGEESLIVLSPESYEELTRGKAIESGPRIYGEHHIDVLSKCHGFVKVRASSINVEVAGVKHNVKEIKKAMETAHQDGVHILVLPELCISSYTAGDLFNDQSLIERSLEGLKELKEYSKSLKGLLTFVGLPFRYNSNLYNVAAPIYEGHVLALVAKKHIPNYKEFYEQRYFASALEKNVCINLFSEQIPFGNQTLLVNSNYPDLKIGVELCEDLWVENPPSTALVQAGASIIVNLSASNEVVGKKEYRESLVSMTSARLISGYIYASAGRGESSTDLIFGGQCLIAENGSLLANSGVFTNESATSEIDLEKLAAERYKMTSFASLDKRMDEVYFSMPLEVPAKLERTYFRNPFIPSNHIDLERVKLILTMQASGLAKRLEAIHCTKAVVGLSGGLDSTLALLVGVEAFKLLNLPLENIEAITLPAFGTSARTKNNASKLAEELGVSFKEINIKESVLSHFKDIGHDPNNYDLTYENAQARERTQVLLDYANSKGALMIGTGDLSELCLGWTTYNGDHMSSYGVNASIPKTLVRYLVQGYALIHEECRDSLEDIVDTPISPELLPPDESGNISQKTEDKIGPYELHDFFIYHYLRFGYRPSKLYYLACQTFEGVYEEATIKKWLREFFRRFFANQFKRSCLPDGAKVGSVAISPRGDWRMPSDAVVKDYLEEIDSF